MRRPTRSRRFLPWNMRWPSCGSRGASSRTGLGSQCWGVCGGVCGGCIQCGSGPEADGRARAFDAGTGAGGGDGGCVRV